VRTQLVQMVPTGFLQLVSALDQLVEPLIDQPAVRTSALMAMSYLVEPQQVRDSVRLVFVSAQMRTAVGQLVEALMIKSVARPSATRLEQVLSYTEGRQQAWNSVARISGSTLQSTVMVRSAALHLGSAANRNALLVSN